MFDIPSIIIIIIIIIIKFFIKIWQTQLENNNTMQNNTWNTKL